MCTDVRPRSPWIGGALGLLWLAWVVLPAQAALAAVGEVVSFLGEAATPEEEARATAHLVRGAVCAVGLPLAGLVLDRVTGGRSRVWPVSTALGVVLAAALLALAPDPTPAPPSPRPARPSDPAACVERSGGDSTCPGG